MQDWREAACCGREQHQHCNRGDRVFGGRNSPVAGLHEAFGGCIASAAILHEEFAVATCPLPRTHVCMAAVRLSCLAASHQQTVHAHPGRDEEGTPCARHGGSPVCVALRSPTRVCVAWGVANVHGLAGPECSWPGGPKPLSHGTPLDLNF